MQPVTDSPREFDEVGRELYDAGEWVTAGLYLNVDTQQEVMLPLPGILPASLDGHVACYVRLQPMLSGLTGPPPPQEQNHWAA